MVENYIVTVGKYTREKVEEIPFDFDISKLNDAIIIWFDRALGDKEIKVLKESIEKIFSPYLPVVFLPKDIEIGKIIQIEKDEKDDLIAKL